ncbi:hypothetical protein IE996_29145 [Klebsiella pneumoniae]|uniref:Uncharacterized protein n=1 Tax=Klebsiella pneumoniae TaxID=573 RepID=A0A927DHC6_KLEPN|nr:hypothetical protein [Klebsiella pneumoniae]MBD3709946.1 hypothetical protein [Klebsiella pneumoniae]MBD3715639.1 hypothetical protein [Klebsiella pneumoniae]MBD3721795.1 hypothetical protein [Klebsiella pneumoniae]
MKTLLSPDLDAQPLLLVDCEARSREALEKNLTRMGIRWHHLTGDEALPPLTPLCSTGGTGGIRQPANPEPDQSGGNTGDRADLT